MSTVEISKEERDLWRFEASDECGTPSEEDERILRLLAAFEALEAKVARLGLKFGETDTEVHPMAFASVEELEVRFAGLNEHLPLQSEPCPLCGQRGHIGDCGGD